MKMKEYKQGDLVRYIQGSIDRVGIVVGGVRCGDYTIQFLSEHKYMRDRCTCRWRCLELVSES